MINKPTSLLFLVGFLTLFLLSFWPKMFF
ncbi:hypothetical protein BTR22_16880 [Alkalihalophilus pseudofirmus]|nr:hypothetical protein BTR22_16880 [Alkalihalophilus pseudofirmus]